MSGHGLVKAVARFNLDYQVQVRQVCVGQDRLDRGCSRYYPARGGNPHIYHISTRRKERKGTGSIQHLE